MERDRIFQDLFVQAADAQAVEDLFFRYDIGQDRGRGFAIVYRVGVLAFLIGRFGLGAKVVLT